MWRDSVVTTVTSRAARFFCARLRPTLSIKTNAANATDNAKVNINLCRGTAHRRFFRGGESDRPSSDARGDRALRAPLPN